MLSWCFPPWLQLTHYHGVQATGLRVRKKSLCWASWWCKQWMCFFRAIHPELCLIQSKATWTHFQKQWLVLLAGALEWPWCLPPPPWSPESWATTDAPNTFSLLIKVKEQQILYERQCLTVCSTKQPERAAAPQRFQILQHKIWIC